MPTDAIVVMGVDPGLRRTGYAFIRKTSVAEPRLIEAGFVRLDARAPLETRLLELDHCLSELVSRHGPSLLACEQLYAHYKHPRTAILMGHARGVILALAARSGVEVVSIASTHVKKFITGAGHAGKRQMQHAVAFALGLAAPPEPHDVADAIAIALCGVQAHAAKRISAETRSDGRFPNGAGCAADALSRRRQPVAGGAA